MFPKRYYRYATKLAAIAHELWLYDKLTERRIRTQLRQIIGDVTLHGGAFRTTALLPNGVIKVPHHPSAIQSTFLEMEFFKRAAPNDALARHFPSSVVVTNGSVPVVIQERVEDIARPTDERVETLVEKFAHRLGVGDTHVYNYGWAVGDEGLYPVFVDCETSTQLSTLNKKDFTRLANATVRWNHNFSEEDIFI